MSTIKHFKSKNGKYKGKDVKRPATMDLDKTVVKSRNLPSKKG